MTEGFYVGVWYQVGEVNSTHPYNFQSWQDNSNCSSGVKTFLPLSIGLWFTNSHLSFDGLPRVSSTLSALHLG